MISIACINPVRVLQFDQLIDWWYSNCGISFFYMNSYVSFQERVDQKLDIKWVHILLHIYQFSYALLLKIKILQNCKNVERKCIYFFTA